MAYGLHIFDSSGNLRFDSTMVAGGVCLGFYTVPTGGGNKYFPAIPGATGFVLMAGFGAPINTTFITIDNVPGYLRFVFSSVLQGFTYAMFAK